MAIKTKLPLVFMFFITVVLASASLSLGYRNDDPEQMLRQCQRRCQVQQPYQLAECQERCREQYQEQKQGGGGGNTEDPRREYQQCQRRCEQEERGQKQQQQCEKRCEDRFREQEREKERERGQGGRGDNPQDPREQYKQCQRRCQRQERGQQEQQQCQKRCKEQFEEQQREHQGGGGSDNTRDPRKQYEQCQQRCQRQERGQQQECQRRCKEQFEEQQREQEREHQGGGGSSDNARDPREQYEQCQQQCQRQEQGQQQQQCERRCKEQYEEQQREQGRDDSREEEQQSNNPYYFDAQRFKSRFKTQEGQLRVLERFSKRSELLRGLENYRLAICEANPNTFVIPHHSDAESVQVVLRGKGTITMVRQENRESFNLERGDIIMIPAGTTVYLINRDNNEKLNTAKLFRPINTPGRYEEYFGISGEDPESFYRVFSNEILEAALNTPRDKIEKLFGQQKKGVIIKATQEQIKALSQHASSTRQRGESSGPYNLLNKSPSHSNKYGKFFEVSPDEYKQLQDMDLSVTFADINQGAMMAPYYNSRSTKMVLVVGGSGRFEMACPHLASQRQGSQGRRREQEEGGRGIHYQKVSARLSIGDAIVIPAGHPVTYTACGNEKLQLLAFGINAQNNQRNFLAGRNNIMNQVESEAKELSFSMPAREVEQIFGNQKDSYFMAGPQQCQQREEGRGQALASILDFAGFF